ncbi:hypothetical protein CZP2022_89 [Vibrio phage C-ZP2022]|nr:hypothetical protein [Vibrio phage vB_pir03]UKZ10812.1 hypothetical protein CZP2022_89 [Vibrio phage C-ZP2022]
MEELAKTVIKSMIPLPVFDHALSTETEWLSFPLLRGISKEVPEHLQWHAENSFTFNSFMGHEVKEVKLGQSYIHLEPHLMVYIRMDLAGIEAIRDELPTIDHYLAVQISGEFEDVSVTKSERHNNRYILSGHRRDLRISDLKGKANVSFSFAENELPRRF